MTSDDFCFRPRAEVIPSANGLTNFAANTYPRLPRARILPLHLDILPKGMSSCRETCGARAARIVSVQPKNALSESTGQTALS